MTTQINIYCVSTTCLGAGNTALYKGDKNPYPPESYNLDGKK